MNLYINRLIPRLKQYSESLSKKELFIEMPWVIIDDDLNQQKYIFKRDGDLVMSLNGQVTIGKWEYLSAARCLLIDRIQDKILLNQEFVSRSVMVLKKDGLKNENFILVNETLLPDLNVIGHLKDLYYQKNDIVLRKLTSGEFLECYDGKNSLYTKVTIDGFPVPDGSVQLADSDIKYVIKDSSVVQIFVGKKDYQTDKGKITIEQKRLQGLSVGDLVYQGNRTASDGKYRLGFFYHIIVKNGQIIQF